MTSAYKIPAPVFEGLPNLPQPDWAVLKNPGPSNYQSHADLEGKIEYLTEQLSQSHDVICAHELTDEG